MDNVKEWTTKSMLELRTVASHRTVEEDRF